VFQTVLSPLYTAVSWIIVQFHAAYSQVFAPNSGWAWGLSIVSLVVLIRICLIPLFVKQIKATRNMQVLQPKMKAIQERYKNDRQRQSEEMMKLYKETGTNPLSSCLPILVQSPFFMALFGVLHSIADGKPVGVIHNNLLNSARDAHIFGAPLSAKFLDSATKITGLHASVTDVRIVTILMIIMMSASQFYTQRQLMTKNVDMTVKTPFMQQQKMLMYVFPIMFAVFGINFPVGVLVYWLTTNVWTMGQQLVVIRRNPTPGSVAFQQREARLKAKGVLTAEPVKTAAARTTEDGQPVRRQQPKRQTKSQRQQSGAVQPQGKDGQPETSPVTGTADNDADPAAGTGGSGAAPAAGSGSGSDDSGKDAKDAKTTGGSGGSAGNRPARQQPKAGPQRKGQPRSKHPSKK
jgi:YidC/Oxa1 family membrane protein insertase